jgi:hypothetical protein
MEGGHVEGHPVAPTSVLYRPTGHGVHGQAVVHPVALKVPAGHLAEMVARSLRSARMPLGDSRMAIYSAQTKERRRPRRKLLVHPFPRTTQPTLPTHTPNSQLTISATAAAAITSRQALTTTAASPHPSPVPHPPSFAHRGKGHIKHSTSSPSYHCWTSHVCQSAWYH